MIESYLYYVLGYGNLKPIGFKILSSFVPIDIFVLTKLWVYIVNIMQIIRLKGIAIKFLLNMVLCTWTTDDYNVDSGLLYYPFYFIYSLRFQSCIEFKYKINIITSFSFLTFSLKKILYIPLYFFAYIQKAHLNKEILYSPKRKTENIM